MMGLKTFVGFNSEGTPKLNGYFEETSPQYKALVSTALAARSIGANTVRVRYEEDGIDCENLPDWNNKIRAIGF